MGHLACLGVVDLDACVQGDYFLGSHQKRVYIQFLNFGIIGSQIGKTHDDLDQCLNVDSRLSTISQQQWPGPERLEHTSRKPFIQWRQTQGAVIDDHRGCSSHAGHEDRAKRRILFCAQDHFNAERSDNHLLDSHSFDHCVWPLLVGCGHDAIEMSSDAILRCQVDGHALHVGLVGDLPRVNLKDNGEADFTSQRNRLVCRGSYTGAGDGNSVGVQQFLRFTFQEQFPRVPADHLAAAIAIRCEGNRDISWCVVQDCFVAHSAPST